MAFISETGDALILSKSETKLLNKFWNRKHNATDQDQAQSNFSVTERKYLNVAFGKLTL